MIEVISILCAAALGFAIGSRYKDCLCKKKQSGNNNKTQNVSFDTTKKSSTNPTGNFNREDAKYGGTLDGFSLKSISNVFKQFNVPLSSSNSFSLLLDTIERSSYKILLEKILFKATSPKLFYDFLCNKDFNIVQFEISGASGAPIISDSELNKILGNENIDYSALNSPKEKIELLLALFQGKGTKRFQESFGSDLSTFIELYESGQSVDTLYNNIMSTIKRRLDFLS